MELLSRHNKKIKKQRIAQATTTLCACSPQSFTFQLLLDNDCSTSTISSALPEFSNVNCQISNNDVDRSRRELRIDIDNNNEHQLQENEKDVGSELDNDRYDVLTSQVQSLLPTVSGQHGGDDSIVTQSETILAYISSILFFEFDTSGQLTIINVDDTYLIPNDQELTNGATITFESISSTLNMSIPLEDQLVPGGAGLLMLGNNEAGDVILRSRFVWEYDLDCGVDADIVDDDNLGDTLGWIEFVSTFSLCFGICRYVYHYLYLMHALL